MTEIPTGMVYVTMQYDGKEFVAYVSGAQDSSEGLDNYQSQEIYEAVRQQIRKITQEEEEDFSFQKSSMDDTDNWKGHGFHNAESITDAYELQTNADRIHVFCPSDKLGEQTDAEFAVQYKRNGQTNYSSCFTEVTNDKKYLWGTIYSDEYEDIRVALFTDKD